MSNEHVSSHTYSDPILKNFKEHRIRIIIDKEGEPWWIASDICDILGLKTNDAVSILDDDEIRIDQFRHDAVDFEFNRILVNRSGAYSIIIVSDYPHKKEFRKFITNQLIMEAEASSRVAKPEIPLIPPLEKCGRGDSLTPVEPAPVKTQDFASLQPVIAVIGTRPITTSLAIAKTFGKNHFDVLKAIKTLDTPKDFTDRNFSLSEYEDSTGRKLPMYQITRDGFTFLAMGFNGKRVTEFKIAYLEAFNKMEEALKKQAYAGIEQKLRTQLALPDPSIIANAKKQGAGVALRLAVSMDKLGLGVKGLARLCSLRQANLTQRECAKVLGLTRERVKDIERDLKSAGITFDAMRGNERVKAEMDKLNAMLGPQGQPTFNPNSNPGFPLSKGGQGVVNQEVSHV